MATPNITDEEIQFRKRARRRLVGAIVLVLIVVVVVPWILPADKPQQDTQQIDIRIPAQDGSGFASKVLPAPAPEAAPAPVATPEPVVAPPAAPAAPITPGEPKAEAKPEPLAKPQVEPTPAPATKPAPKAEAKPETPPLAAAESVYVQYGAFSEAKNAKQRQAELKAKGIATYTEVVKTSAGDRIRVRSGPYISRDAAEKIRMKAKPIDSKLVVIGGKG